MSRQTIQEAQEFLTVHYNEGVKKILDIETLLKRHSVWRVKEFLDQMFKERQQVLKDLISTDKTNHKVDETIARMFRLNMAIKTIEREVSI